MCPRDLQKYDNQDGHETKAVNKAVTWFILVAASMQVSKRPRIDALSFNSVTRALTRPGFTGL